MKNDLLISIQDSLGKIRQWGKTDDLPNVTAEDLEAFTDEELQAFDTFLKKSQASLGEFYEGHAAALSKANSEYEKSSDSILEGEKEKGNEQKIKGLQTFLKWKK